MFQTILDDVDLDRENANFETASERFVSDSVARLPKVVQTAGKTAFVAQDTWAYKMLSQGTQMSDFVARFVLYEDLKRKQAAQPNNPEYRERKIMGSVREAFVNYNRPTDRKLQYMNDIGLVRFTKYFLGTQKILYQRMKKAPAQSLAVYMADRYTDNIESVFGSTPWDHDYFKLGPLDAPSVIDEPFPISFALGLFR